MKFQNFQQYFFFFFLCYGLSCRPYYIFNNFDIHIVTVNWALHFINIKYIQACHIFWIITTSLPIFNCLLPSVFHLCMSPKILFSSVALTPIFLINLSKSWNDAANFVGVHCKKLQWAQQFLTEVRTWNCIKYIKILLSGLLSFGM